MMSLEQQSEYLAMTYTADQLDDAMRVLNAAAKTVAGAQGKVDLDSIAVVREALHLRRVQEKVEDALQGVHLDY